MGRLEASSARLEGDGSIVLGLDEAGRGSLVGPLVIGGFALATDRLSELTSLGVRDSKQLSPARREEIYMGLGQLGRRLSILLSPATVDRYVRHGRLNHLEAQTFGRLVRRAGASRVFVDACDPVADRFGREVVGWARVDVPIISEHRADERYPIVSAASIVAKVRRDRAIEQLRRSVGNGLGSGYPSDDATCAFVRSVLEGGGPTPPWIRQSWRTMGRLKPRPVGSTLDAFHS